MKISHVISFGILIAFVLIQTSNRAEYAYADLSVVQLAIMGDVVLNETSVEHYDINMDGEIISMDYVMILNELKGR